MKSIAFKKTNSLPKDWDLVRIGDISSVRRGASPRPIGDPRYFSIDGRGWVRISDVTSSRKKIKKTTQYLSELGARKSVPVNPNDLIMSICATIGKPIIVDMEACIHDGFVVFSNLKDTISTEYFYYILQRLEKDFEAKGQEGTQKNLNTSLVKKTLIQLPPLLLQNKIAEILSTVDADIEKTDAIIKETQQLKKGLMEKFFRNKAFFSMKLAKSEKTELMPIYLKNLGKIITGTTPSTKVEEYYNANDYMFIGPADLGLIKYIEKSNKYISEKGFRVSRQLSQNTVMVVCIGATIGKVGITSKPCATNQQINSIIPKKEFPADYVYYLMSGIKKYLLAFSGDTATPILNKGEFGKVVSFVHKSFEERKKISDILSEVDEKIENELAFKSELEQLKKCLLQVLLTGKVRVKV